MSLVTVTSFMLIAVAAFSYYLNSYVKRKHVLDLFFCSLSFCISFLFLCMYTIINMTKFGIINGVLK